MNFQCNVTKFSKTIDTIIVFIITIIMLWDNVLFCRSLLLDFENSFPPIKKTIHKINALKLLQSLRPPASVT